MRRSLVAAIFILGIVVGVLLGVALDAKYHTNDISFVVPLDSQEAVLSPQVGDEITWYAIDSAGKRYMTVAPTFIYGRPNKSSPCPGGADANPCEVQKPAKGLEQRTYDYTCTFQLSGRTYSCLDPEIGPLSATSGIGAGNRLTKTRRTFSYLKVLKWDIGSLLTVEPPSTEGTVAAGAPRPAITPAGTTTDPADPPPIAVALQVGCSETDTITLYSTAGNDKPVLAYNGEKLHWPPNTGKLTFTLSDPSKPFTNVCLEADPASVGCTISPTAAVNTSVSYTISVDQTLCANPSKPEKITVVAKPPPPT